MWIAIHKHMIEQGRHGRPRASLDRPWPQRDERTQTPCRHRRSAVHSANRRHQLRASSCHDLISKRARLDRRRPLACFESMPGRYSARPGGAGRGPGQEARAGRAGSMVAEQVRWSPAYPFSAAPSAAQSVVASFEVDAPADLPHGTGAVSPADCRPIGAGWASIRAEGAYRAGLNCRRHTRPAARPPRLDRLSRSAPFPMMWRQHSTAVLPRSCRGSAASCEPSRCAHVFCCRLRRQAPTRRCWTFRDRHMRMRAEPGAHL